MKFLDYQKVAKRNSLYLSLLFLLSLILTIFATCVVVLIGLLAGFVFSDYPESVANIIIDNSVNILIYSAIFIIFMFVFGSIVKYKKISAGGAYIAKDLGAKEIVRNAKTSEKEIILLNIIDEISVASGIKSPRVFKTRDQKSINAFVAGTTMENCVICLTRGAINLSRDSLQSVIAHQYSHIYNNIMRKNMYLSVFLYGLNFLHQISFTIFNALLPKKMKKTENSIVAEIIGRLLLPFIIFAIIFYSFGYFSHKFLKIIKSKVNNQVIYLADASAVQFTRNPVGLVNALKKTKKVGSMINSKNAEEYSYFYFANEQTNHHTTKTHPDIEKRISRINSF